VFALVAADGLLVHVRIPFREEVATVVNEKRDGRLGTNEINSAGAHKGSGTPASESPIEHKPLRATRLPTVAAGRDALAASSDRPATASRVQRAPSAVPGRAAEILERLSREIGETHFQRYFDGQTRVSVAGSRVDVTVPSEYLARLLDRRFGDQIRRAAGTAAARPGTIEDDEPVEVRFRVDRTIFPDSIPAEPPSTSQATPARPSTPQRAEPIPSSTPRQAPARHRLDDFVVGTTNKLAYSAALRMAEDDNAVGSLFIHGLCGMGKTHLLQGVASRFLERNPGASVRCVTAEAFTNEYITAVKGNRVDAFRKLYRRVDLLCIDDVHFLSAKEGTQNELTHTFDAIGLEGARVVLVSDEHPRDIAKLSEKLVSRFMAGVVVRIDPPDGELRVRLVRHLARRRNLQLEEAAVQIIADRSARSMGTLGGFGGSVREIDGLLIQIDAVHRLLPDVGATGGIVGAILVRKALGLTDTEGASNAKVGSARVRKPIPIETITSEVCRAMTVDITELMGTGRHKRVVLARAICVHVARKLTTLSYPEIARGMGRPNHSTVITAHQRLNQQFTTDFRYEPEVLAGLGTDLRSLTLPELAEELCRRVARACS
jgi:chromosomal replication initiator protein